MADSEQMFTIPNELGLHARVASRMVKLCAGFSSSIGLTTEDGRNANAKSVLDLLTLGAEQGHQITVSVSGDDAQDAMSAINELFQNNLGD